MNKKNFLKVFSSAMALSLILTGCSSSSKSNKGNTATNVSSKFKNVVDNEGTAVADATLKIGIVSSDPLTGMFNPVFALNSTDVEAMSGMGGAFSTDEQKRISQDNTEDPIKFHLDKEKSEVTLTIHEGLKWSNGEDVTSDDIIATYNLMGNPKYTENVRYDDSYEAIAGMKEYHEGSASSISGITKKDEKTVVIKYKKMTPALLFGNGFISEFLNKKQVETASVDFTKFAEAELNTKPLSYGPYVIDKVVNGESVLTVANPYFYKKDKVKVKKIEYKVIAPAQVSSAIKAGDVDIVSDLTTGVYQNIKDSKNGTVLGESDRYISYVGFKLGKYDKEKGVNVTDPNAKAADERVRQAFGYAVDWDQINEKIYAGLRFTPTNSGLFPPVSFLYSDNGTKYTKDVEKAKKLLDEAGLKDTDGDGLREDKNGKKLTFKFAIRDTGQKEVDQPLADTLMKSWKEVGLDVQLTDGKLMSPKDWTQRVQTDDSNIDIFQGAWGLGTDPNPTSTVGTKSPLNFTRYVNSELNGFIEKMDNNEMFDLDKMKEVYKDFDTTFAKQSPWLPLSWRYKLTWVNSRVKHYSIKPYDPDFNIYDIELTASEGKK